MDAAGGQEHWQRVYETKAPDALSWYAPHLQRSLALIERAANDRTAAILDAGGGASTLVDDLLARGYTNLAVLDIAKEAIAAAQRRLGERAARVRWLCADLLSAALEPAALAVWHDRAVFHFLTGDAARRRYAEQAAAALCPGGHLLVSTFALDGPERCSGLPVRRYDAASLQKAFAPRFRLIESATEQHRTPSGAIQPFVDGHFVLEHESAAAEQH